jgi:hypothetical protein
MTFVLLKYVPVIFSEALNNHQFLKLHIFRFSFLNNKEYTCEVITIWEECEKHMYKSQNYLYNFS